MSRRFWRWMAGCAGYSAENVHKMDAVEIRREFVREGGAGHGSMHF